MLKNALSENTQRTYNSAQKQFLQFCEQNRIFNDNGSPIPASELTLLRFMASMSKTCKASSMRVYLSAVRALHIQVGFPDPLVGCSRIPLVIRGLRRSKSGSCNPKVPITLLVLYAIRSQLNLASHDDIMLWAACCVAFFGFLRASEFTVPPHGFLANKHLSLKDISVDKQPIPDNVFMQLKYSKTDQFGKGANIVLARTDTDVCPVSALMSYLHVRGPTPGPLFLLLNGMPLTKSRLNTRLQHILKQCGWPGVFTLHSFRVGAATTAASLGFPDYLIQALGRWTSDAYKVYIKLPQERLHFASKSLGTLKAFNQSQGLC